MYVLWCSMETNHRCTSLSADRGRIEVHVSLTLEMRSNITIERPRSGAWSDHFP